MGQSLYEEIGGAGVLDVAVAAFYRKLVTDPSISHFFDGVDGRSLKAKQKAFFALIMGGPVTYAGKDMRAAHAHLVKRGLNDAHFDTVLKHLRETLEDLRMPVAAAAQIMAAADSTRNDVLGR